VSRYTKGSLELMQGDYFSSDTQEFLVLLNKYEVKYLIVGGEAVIYYGYARLTGDVDFFYDISEENVQKLYQVLDEFWGGNIPGIENVSELSKPGLIFLFGIPPHRIDLINTIQNVSFPQAWLSKTIDYITINKQNISIYFIGLDDLIKNKESLDRPKDLEDLKYLKKIKEKSSK